MPQQPRKYKVQLGDGRFKHPLISGESDKDRRKRLKTEARHAREEKKREGRPPNREGRPRVHPTIEGESREDRDRRLSRERQANRTTPRVKWRPTKETMKSKSLKAYGLTLDQYHLMVEEQRGLCKICKRDNKGKSLYIDHCHTTNKVRGLLCHHCNFGIGQFRDSPELLKEAIAYLEFSFDPERDLVCV